MEQENASSRTSSIPQILFALLELGQHSDDDLSSEATLALKFFFERECIDPVDTDWLTNVEAFLVFKENLAAATGAESIKDLRVRPEERDALAYEVFRRIEGQSTHAWRYAYILKQAICVPGLQDDAAEYLRTYWQKDEAVSQHLLNVIWGVEDSLNYDATLKDISEHAMSLELRDHAAQSLRVRKEIAKWHIQNPEP